MRIEFNLPHVFHPGASAVENAYALRASLDYLVALNRAFLRTHAVPSLYRSGVRYGRTRVWETIPALYQRGFGDCKSLTAAYIAELQKRGMQADPVFRWIRTPEGGTDFHILVQTIRGFEDPSKVLGMGSVEVAPLGPNDD